jgi:hypothetical protein
VLAERHRARVVVLNARRTIAVRAAPAVDKLVERCTARAGVSAAPTVYVLTLPRDAILPSCTMCPATAIHTTGSSSSL